MFFNGADRYENNAAKIGNKLFSLGSHETKNKLRFDMNKFKSGWKYNYGVDAQYVKYDADIFNTIKEEVKDNNGNIISPAVSFSSTTAVDFFKFGVYGQVAKRFFDDKFLVSGGLRADINTYTKNGLNPLKTLSPRVSFYYAFNNQ